jgi:hypothetical protein
MERVAGCEALALTLLHFTPAQQLKHHDAEDI